MKTTKNTSKPFKSLLMSALIALLFMACKSEVKDDQVTQNEAPNISIHEAVFMNNVKAIEEHVQAGTDLNVLDDYGSMPLTVAATFGKTAAALKLIDGGADINHKSGDGSTPLHTAAFFGRVEIVEALLTEDADLSIRNNYGTTALESVSAPFADVKMIYDQLSKDLGPFGLKLDYDKLAENRTMIAQMISSKTK